MFIAGFPAGQLGANCYFVGAEAGGECVIIDPGQDSAEGVDRLVEEHSVKPAAILVTHGHFDHMWQAQVVADKYDAPLWIGADDRHLLKDPMVAISNQSASMLRQQFGMDELPDFREPGRVHEAVEGSVIEIEGLTMVVDHAPGHTPGTVLYRTTYEGPEDVSQLMFSGDFLFQGSIGRTDLVGGDHSEMLESLRSKVLPLSDNIVVFPGHGEQTSIGRERATNPFLLELQDTPVDGGQA
ncbi:MBL fold metallo-hydrolase [Nocardioides sp. JQ2195]|uniref:MBL fold metallo-hydrolase n=1 Tax=Nocardioides sp. JQ2195 TaxID=2592334 RepID=UPI00143E7F33|nr:MBL fold metallo-hydrolase [Nocardioides sp. JQ2195]QIX26907.1 MBL fold metallo-hydrolase [Nocardioides sp. JQ2195]